MQTQNSVILLLHGENDTLIWGMTNAERVRRLVEKLQSKTTGNLWVNLAYVFDPQWIRYVHDNPGTLVTMDGVPVLAHLRAEDDAEALAALRIPTGARVLEYQDKPRIHNPALRKLETPFVRELTPATVKDIERQSYFGAYKGVTDILTKYLWPELALVLTRFAARIGMTPNMVTSIGAIGCIGAIFLFYYGYFWTGMAAGFVFMVLDTVDGKLARCTITSSFWGNILFGVIFSTMGLILFIRPFGGWLGHLASVHLAWLYPTNNSAWS